MDEKISELYEETISSEEVYSGVLLKIYRDEVRLPDGSATVRELNRHFGAVSIAAITDDGRIAVVRQYRYPFGRVFTEIPAGKLDAPDEDPLAAAKRELREETGLTAESWESLGTLVPTCAYSTERIHMFAARGLMSGAQELDKDEFLSAEFMPLSELYEMALSGAIEDSKTLVSVLKLMSGIFTSSPTGASSLV